MLALEDARTLRLLAGISAADLAGEKPVEIANSPTRFGRVGLSLEPLDGQKGWRLKFQRGAGPAPDRVELPSVLGRRFRFSKISRAGSQEEKNVILAAPGATSWEAVWKATL